MEKSKIRRRPRTDADLAALRALVRQEVESAFARCLPMLRDLVRLGLEDAFGLHQPPPVKKSPRLRIVRLDDRRDPAR